MKTALMILLCLIISTPSYADIKNGFEEELEKAKKAKENLKILIDRSTDNDIALAKLSSMYTLMKVKISSLRDCFFWTDELIKSLQKVHPELYDEINHIKDYNGNITDVYISALPEDQMKEVYWGTTNLNHTDRDENTYQSTFGPRSVSVIVRQCEKSKCLRLLIHELGHVKYQVPNLASYMKYFENKYQYAQQNDPYGHKKDDPSNRSVIDELNRFNEVLKIRKLLFVKNKRGKDNSQ